MHDDLHWLIIRQRVLYTLAVTAHRCLRHRAPWYLADYCMPVSEVPGRQHLQSARCHQLSVHRVRRSTFGTVPTVHFLSPLAGDAERPYHQSGIHCLIQLLTPNNRRD